MDCLTDREKDFLLHLLLSCDTKPDFNYAAVMQATGMGSMGGTRNKLPLILKKLRTQRQLVPAWETLAAASGAGSAAASGAGPAVASAAVPAVGPAAAATNAAPTTAPAANGARGRATKKRKAEEKEDDDDDNDDEEEVPAPKRAKKDAK